MRNHNQLGASLLEVAIVLSILSSLAILAAPTIAKTKRDAYVLQCKAQMQEIGVALIKYRDEHQGKMPHHSGELVPRYLDEAKMVCPLTRHLSPTGVKAWQAYCDRFPESSPGLPGKQRWASYYFVSPYLHDIHNSISPSTLPLSHAELLIKRGNETPMFICRDHREPFSLDYDLGVPENQKPKGPFPRFEYPLWQYPEDDVIVLRWNGDVTTTKKGGSRLQRTFVSTMSDLIEL